MSGQTTTAREMLQTQALVQIIDNLPDQLERQSAAWDPVDKALCEKLRVPYFKTKLEAPKPTSYFSGVRLGVLSIPWENFPTLATMVDRAAPSPESAAFDQSSRVFIDSLYVECIVRSEPFDTGDVNDRVYQEGVVDRRAKRTSDAIVQCLEIDPSLGGLFEEIEAGEVTQTDPFDIDSDQPGKQSKSMVFALVRAQWNLTVYSDRPEVSQTSPSVLPDAFGAF